MNKFRFIVVSGPPGEGVKLLSKLDASGFHIVTAGIGAISTGPQEISNHFFAVGKIAIEAPETPVEKEAKELANRKIVPFRPGMN